LTWAKPPEEIWEVFLASGQDCVIMPSMFSINTMLELPDILDFSSTGTKRNNPDEWAGSGKVFVMDKHGGIMDKTALQDIEARTKEYNKQLKEAEKNAKPLTEDDMDFLADFERTHCKSTVED
jgi:hypothetical protein